jgi:transposase
MASRPIDLTATHARLKKLYATLGTRRAVALKLKVDEKTVARWLRLIKEAELEDPRPSKPPKKPRQKREPKIVLAE